LPATLNEKIKDIKGEEFAKIDSSHASSSCLDKCFLYEETPKLVSKKSLHSKIPKSPMLSRRKSMDNCSNIANEDEIIVRRIPAYKFIQKCHQPRERLPLKENLNTWNGRSCNPSSNRTKNRPHLTTETFKIPQRTASLTRNTPSGTDFPTQQRPFSRTSGNSSPKKVNNNLQSQLAIQLMNAAENGRNDAQILGKIKQILSEYGTKKKPEDDFKVSNSAIVKNLKNSEGKSNDGNDSTFEMKLISTISDSDQKSLPLELSSDSATRRPIRAHITKIPAPVRSKTGLY
jgi:hypothetical protein